MQAVLRLCAARRVPFVARGAGTGLSGGALPVADGVVISLARMNRILEIDLESQRVVVEPGVANLDVTRAVAADGFFYAPDPSSQQVCTIGGNVAENSGGAHCLKHGFTVNHVTGRDGRPARRRAARARREGARRRDGPDLLGVVVGSEGTLGIAVEVTLRIVRQPEVGRHAARRRSDRSTRRARRSRAIVAAGILPAAMEIMDRLTIEAAEAAFTPGYPDGAGAVLLVELDGVAAQVEEDAAAVDAICRELRRVRAPHGAATTAERALLWKGRKGAFAAMGRVSPDYYVQDGVVPRTRLPEVLRRIEALSARARPPRRQRLPRGRREPPPARPLRRATRARPSAAKSSRRRSSSACLDAGGSLTGEHGVGVDKACAMPTMFSERDLEVVRAAPARLRPRRAREPGQGPPDAAPLRRGAGAVPRPPARADSGLPSVSSPVVEEAVGAPRRRRADGRAVRIGDDLRPTGSTGSSSTRPAT